MDTEQNENLRRAERNKSLHGGTIMFGGKSTFDCVIKSRNQLGFGLTMGSTVGVPDYFKLVEKHNGKIHSCRVVWRKSTMLGVELLDENNAPIQQSA